MVYHIAIYISPQNDRIRVRVGLWVDRCEENVLAIAFSDARDSIQIVDNCRVILRLSGDSAVIIDTIMNVLKARYKLPVKVYDFVEKVLSGFDVSISS